LPENPPLYLDMTVYGYLKFVAEIKGVPRKQIKSEMERVANLTSVGAVMDRVIINLSKGFRQRVGLAQALLNDPEVLILDEPTVGLDPLQIKQTLGLIKELGQEHTILLSTHILAEVEAICERVIIIRRGRIGMDKKLAELASDKAIIVLEVRGPSEQVTNVLRTTDGVSEVMPAAVSDNITSYEIHTHEDQDLRELIGQRVAKNGWALRRLDLRRRSLEDHFANVVVREQDTYSPDTETKPLSEAIQPKPEEVAATQP